MRKLHLTFLLCISNFAFTQQTPTGTPQPNVNYNDWFRGGNSGNNLSPNIFGTNWNSPIYTITNGINRMKLNGSLNYAIDGYNVARSGYLLLGSGVAPSTGLFNNANLGAYSQLHLTGRNGTFVQTGGHRPWMETGITFTDNQDLSYMGLRKVGSGFDITETVLGWADNSGSGVGPDCMTFRFFGGGNGSTTISNNLQTVNDLDGLHVAQFAPTGEFGLGNTFGVNAAGMPANLYVRPQSLMHLSLSNYRSVWQQYTNRNITTGSGTGESNADGLRVGIVGHNNQNINGSAMVYNQENKPLLLSTNANTNTANLANGNSQERMRIMSVSTPTHIQGGTYGIYNPGSLSGNLTRVAISHNPSAPVTRPLSLLHLGYNTSSNFLGSPQVDGWRPWMDVGMFVSYNSDNMYVGLKNEGSDRKDAVIDWGDNQPDTTNGPDRLRFIFTASNTTINNPGNPVSQSANGLETMRIVPFENTTYYIKDTNGTIIDTVKTYGRVGIGDFTAQGVNQEPTHKLDVVGNGRFRYLPDSLYMADSTVNKYVMVDSLGVLRWGNLPNGLACWDLNGNSLQDSIEDINGDGLWNALDCQGIAGPQGPAGGNIVAQNGLTLLGGDTVELGGLLLHNTEVTLNNYDMVFNNSYGNFIVGNTNLQTPGNNVHQNIILGLNNNINIMPSVSPNGWLHRILGNNNTVYSHQNHIFGNSNEVGMANDDYAGVSDFIIGENNKAHITSSANQSYVFGKSNQVEGVNSFAFGIDNKATHEDAYCFGNKNIAPHWRAQAIGNMVYAPYYTVSIGNGSNNSGSANNIQNYVAGGGDLNNIHSDPTFTTQEDIPAININLVNNVAIKKYSATSALDVNGNILQSGNAVTSDATLKHNIQDYEVNADSLLNLLQPRTFEWNTIADTFMLGTQYGFIAQEFEQVIPEFVRQGADGIRHINTGALFPLLVLGYKHQSSTIDSLETVTSQLQANNDSLQSQVQDLNNRLTQLENCLSGILPLLCQLNHDAIQATTPAAQEEVRKSLNVILNNREAIILDQNVPNPFAEQTVINFTIPTSVQKAQIHFYDGMGKLLQSVEITERGQGSITVFGADLSSGIYTYNLVADGQIVATKKMMRE